VRDDSRAAGAGARKKPQPVSGWPLPAVSSDALVAEVPESGVSAGEDGIASGVAVGCGVRIRA
jgi:hypothetical protein